MELRKEKINTFLTIKKAELRFELFEWLKSHDLTAKEALEILRITREEIHKASFMEKL